MLTPDDSYVLRSATLSDVSLTQTEWRRPSVMFRPRVFLDGDRWCALYGENIQEGVCGFGETPERATRDFDIAWYGLRGEGEG